MLEKLNVGLLLVFFYAYIVKQAKVLHSESQYAMFVKRTMNDSCQSRDRSIRGPRKLIASRCFFFFLSNCVLTTIVAFPEQNFVTSKSVFTKGLATLSC